jgi:triphosphoribosyl-dephospho-CoA synthetase
MAAREPVTHGEKLFHRFGEKGIRGQAEEGFPILADVAMPVIKKLNMSCGQKPVPMGAEDAAEAENRLKELLSLKPEQGIREDIRREMETNRTWKWKPMEGPLYQNAAYVYVLLSIMSVLDDTNVLTRGTPELLEAVKTQSREILRCGALFTEEGYRKVMEFNDFCVRENLSPGGAADILAVSILLNRLERLTP